MHRWISGSLWNRLLDWFLHFVALFAGTNVNIVDDGLRMVQWSLHTEETSENIEKAELDEAWDLQLLLVTVARIEALFGYSKDKQDTLITFAEAPSPAHT
jgi:hypothetical protein